MLWMEYKTPISISSPLRRPSLCWFRILEYSSSFDISIVAIRISPNLRWLRGQTPSRRSLLARDPDACKNGPQAGSARTWSILIRVRVFLDAELLRYLNILTRREPTTPATRDVRLDSTDC